MKPNALHTLVYLTLGITPAHAIILFGLGNTDNTTDPLTGAPYESVARLSNGAGVFGGSGIYLGNRYVLTANHVGPYASVTFDGITSYAHDGIAPVQIGTTDMKIFRLTTAPTVAAVQLYTGNSEVGSTGTMVGWGVGREPATAVNSTLVPWGDDSTSDKRWGLNTPTAFYDGFTAGSHTFDILQTTLGSSSGTPAGLGVSEAAATLLDSGSGLFHFLDGQWYLTGLTTNLTQRGGGSTSTFGNDVSGVLTPPVSPATNTQIGLFPGAGDINIFARVSSYADDINTLIPEPSSVLLSLTSALFLLRRRR